MATVRRGRKAKVPKTELGIFLQKHLDSRGLTRAEFAKRLGVSPPTIARMLNGDTKVIHSQQIHVESISNVLGLDEAERQTFLKIVGGASFALTTGTQAPATLKYHIDLDLAEDHAQTLQYLLNQGGDVQHVVKSAGMWYSALLNSSSDAKEVRLATIQIRFGLLLGGAQEVILPWYKRTHALQIYDSIENDVISRFKLNTFQHEYAILHSRRAPLYRDLYNYDESRKQFDDGRYWAKSIDNPALRITLFDHAHISATLGQETQWHRQIEEAYREALAMGHSYRDAALVELSHVEAEGYKRLAFNPYKELPRQLRLKYAKKAYDIFVKSLTLTEQCDDVYSSVAQISTEQTARGHSLLTRVGLAQCLVLVDPEEAIRIIEQIRNDILIHYPGLVVKIERTLSVAQGQLHVHRSNPLLLFARE